MPPHATRSHIEMLPKEVFQKIFYCCLPIADADGSESDIDGSKHEPDGQDRFVSPDRKTAPLLLTEVSKGWRETALNTTELWCSLRVDSHDHRIETNDGIMYPSIAEKMETWLTRTGKKRGLCIFLRVCRCIDGNDADRYANEALKVLLRYMHRWEAIKLYWGRETAP